MMFHGTYSPHLGHGEVTEVVDWSESARTAGFSSLSTNLIYFQKIGNMVFMNVNIIGTSNSSGVGFNLPYPTINDYNLPYINVTAKCQDNSAVVTTTGRVDNYADLADELNREVYLYRSHDAPTWTASGTKEWTGQFCYFTDKRSNYDYYAPDASIDFSTGAGVTGFSALTRNNFFYYRVKNIVFCRVYYTGTSNATSITATLPFPSTYLFNSMSGIVTNNGVRLTTTGLAEATAGSSTVTLFRNATKTNYTASGSKIWAGYFWYFTND